MNFITGNMKINPINGFGPVTPGYTPQPNQKTKDIFNQDDGNVQSKKEYKAPDSGPKSQESTKKEPIQKTEDLFDRELYGALFNAFNYINNLNAAIAKSNTLYPFKYLNTTDLESLFYERYKFLFEKNKRLNTLYKAKDGVYDDITDEEHAINVIYSYDKNIDDFDVKKINELNNDILSKRKGEKKKSSPDKYYDYELENVGKSIPNSTQFKGNEFTLEDLKIIYDSSQDFKYVPSITAQNIKDWIVYGCIVVGLVGIGKMVYTSYYYGAKLDKEEKKEKDKEIEIKIIEKEADIKKLEVEKKN